MDEEDFKVRENRARRAAKRQGLELVKSRRRDPRSLGYGGYQLVDAQTGKVVAGEVDSRRALSIEDVERELDRGRR